MALETPRLKLVKPDTSELADINVLNGNFDKIDVAPGVTICTSSTRPTNPYSGQHIFETDTGRLLFWDSTHWYLVSAKTLTKKSAHENTSKTVSTIPVAAYSSTVIANIENTQYDCAQYVEVYYSGLVVPINASNGAVGYIWIALNDATFNDTNPHNQTDVICLTRFDTRDQNGIKSGAVILSGRVRVTPGTHKISVRARTDLDTVQASIMNHTLMYQYA